MKKKIYMLCLIIICFMSFTNQVFAYGYDISVTSNTITVGNSVSLNIKVTDAAGKFLIKSSNTSIVSVSNSSLWIDNTTSTVTLKANKVGSATITITADDVTSYSSNTITGSKTINITVKEKSTNNNSGGNSNTTAPQKVKSSNNYLTSITIDGLSLEEKFDKETLNYTVNVPAETEKIKINAQVNDSTATVSGTGIHQVTTGINNFSLVVTAENGSKRTYTIKANVLELEPLKVDVDNNEYTIVRKRKELPAISDFFEEKDITINNEKIEGYYNEKLDYTIVGLKDSKGNIEFYINKNNKYTIYKEYIFNGTALQIIDKELTGNYKETTFIYNSDKIKSYQETKIDIIKNTYAVSNEDIIGNQFYLFYAKNIETGKENLYQYDAVEKTIQRYNIEVLDMYKNNNDTYYMYLLIAIATVIILIMTIIVMKIKSYKKKK